ncbi:MAG: acyl-CoA dehydrogenase [Gammaproteobacteria bacterium]
MASLFWFLLFTVGSVWLAYRRSDLKTFTIAFAIALFMYTPFGEGHWLWLLFLWLILGSIAALNIEDVRRERVTRPLLDFYRQLVPSMSDTEREALEAGTVWWEGELFTGRPDWEKLQSAAPPRLSEEEQAFLDGPTEELCRMIDDWEISHELADMPPRVWDFIKKKGFFAMIIPKKYGGLEFSAYAHSCVLAKLSSRSSTVASTVGVPNSLGPAELLLYYGTEVQRQRYLPGLASGEEVPCFALTGPRAGSDAASIPDTGVVCKGIFSGKEITGMRLNWQKRYITLAPVATVLGLAFKLYDPDRLIGDKEDCGITAALVPTKLPGVTIGRRHFPLNVPFQNGPTEGRDVFVPLDYIIGGPDMAGQGWRMLVEVLSVGRSISLPSNTTGAAKAATYASGAYCRIRKQFNLPIGRFEGVQEALARIAGYTYIMDAARSVTTAAIDAGEKPAVPSAILKYHVTEMGRQVANDAMDVHGGKGICLGPRNYLGRGYQSVPIAITVEGANILTRSLIIYGQGAVRGHPYVLREMHAAQNEDKEEALVEFDELLFGHIGYAISNAARSFVMALTFARYASVPASGATRRYYQHINRFSAAFALASDGAMLTLGGTLKQRELLSARLGDVLSYIYLASMVLKHYENQGRNEDDLPLVEWTCRSLMYRAQEQLHGLLRNFPHRLIATLIRFFIFPRGRTYYAPADRLGAKVVDLIMNPTATRERLCDGIYKTPDPENPLGLLQEALVLATELEPLERRLRDAVKTGEIPDRSFEEQIRAAVDVRVLKKSEAEQLTDLDRKVMALIAVDDFDPAELRAGTRSAPAARPVVVRPADKKKKKKKAAARRKKAARKKTS